MAAKFSSECRLCLEKVAELNVLLDRGKEVRGEPSVLKEIRDELDQFHLWCLHWKGDFTVNHMLRYEECIREGVVELLEDSHEPLNDVFEILSGQRIAWDEVEWSESESGKSDPEDVTGCPYLLCDDRTELEEIMLLMRTIMNCLNDLTRRTKLLPLCHVLTRASKVDVTAFIELDANFVMREFPAAHPRLQKRLGELNSKRRQLLQYWKQHAEVAHALDRDRGELPVDRRVNESSADAVRTQPQPSTSIPQAIVATSHVHVMDLHDDALCAAASTATGDLESSRLLRIPDPSDTISQGRAFECPFCFEKLKGFTDESWRRHVLRDLRPYSCTFDGRTGTVELGFPFANEHQWFEHEDMHRRTRICSECGISHTGEAELHEHILQQHADGRQLMAWGPVINSTGGPLPPETPLQCPLCLKTVGDFRRHVSRHLRTLALFVLPPVTKDAEEEVDSNDAISPDTSDSSGTDVDDD